MSNRIMELALYMGELRADVRNGRINDSAALPDEEGDGFLLVKSAILESKRLCRYFYLDYADPEPTTVNGLSRRIAGRGYDDHDVRAALAFLKY